MTSVYQRITCPLCEQTYQARGGAMVSVMVAEDRTATICFRCARKLYAIGILQRGQLPNDQSTVTRIVEI